MITLDWFVHGFVFGVGVIVGGTLAFCAIDYVYRKLGRP